MLKAFFQKHKGIRGETGEVILASCFVMTTVFAVLFFFINENYKKTQVGQVEKFLETISLSFNEEIANEMFSGQSISLKESISNIQKSTSMISIIVYSVSGEIKMHVGEILRRRIDKDEINLLGQGKLFKVITLNGGDVAKFSSKISVLDEVFGYIEFYYDLNEIDEYLDNITFLLSFMLFLTFLAVYVFLYFFLSQTVVKPVLKLRDEMVGFEQDKWGEQIKINQKNEIGDMYQAFNDMSQKLQHGYIELAKSNQNLIDEMSQRKEAQKAMKNLEEELDIRQRTKIAGELHDGLGQSLQAANLGLKMMGADLAKGQALEPQQLSNLQDEVSISILQLRQITTELRPVFLDKMGLPQALVSHAQKLSSYIQAQITTDVDDEGIFLERIQKEHIFLIFQEALNNAIKHSNADLIKVGLHKEEGDSLLLTVQDYGQGIGDANDMDHGEGIGLSLMKDRAEALGGDLNVTSNGSGTKVLFRMKING